MERSVVFSNLMVQDRLIRLNIQMLEGLLREIKADVEEFNILAEGCLNEKELSSYRESIIKMEAELLSALSGAIDHLYDLYEVFNFDITFLATLPEELPREIERLDIAGTVNTILESIHTILTEVLASVEEDSRLSAIMIPFRVYREVIRQGIEFNRRLYDLSFQKTG